MKLTRKAQRLLNELDTCETFEDNTNNCPADEVPGSIPMLGNVAAGTPIDAIENAELISLQTEFGNSDTVFALKVTGDSMIDDGIYDGDTVICQQTKTAPDGQLVVAMVDDETATVKRIYKEADCIRLEPANENYEPIYTQNCKIAGKVIGLMRKL